MKVNFTIIVQIINFFIGFLLLKYLLFKPAAKYLQDEEKKEEALTQKIDGQQRLLENKIEKKKTAWSGYQAQFQKSCPKPVTTQVFALEKERKEPKISEISDSEIEQTTQKVKEAFIQRVQHVRK